MQHRSKGQLEAANAVARSSYLRSKVACNYRDLRRVLQDTTQLPPVGSGDRGKEVVRVSAVK